MALKSRTKHQIIKAKGTARYPHITEPYKKFEPEFGVFTCDVIVDKEQADELDNKIDPKGQGNAVTANFIHSLDACIVHQVANEVDFDLATIHDCFVTHACNVRKCNTIVRQMYAKTFSVDLLEEFRVEQINNNPTVELPSVPELGDLDVTAVKRMKYLLS